MAFAPPVDFQRPSSQLSIDRKPALFSDEFETSEESFMESAMISPAEDRRDSFGHATGPVFSPPSTVWEDFSTTPAIPDRQFGSSTNPFLEHSNNPFLRQDSALFSAQQNAQWPAFDHGPESRGPMAPSNYDAYNGDFESAPAQAFPHGGPFGPMPPNVRPASVFPPSQTPVPMSASPPPAKDWMGMAEQGHMDSRLPKRLRGQSPSQYPPNYRHGDGIRKKNARFDIPQERNLANIDRLIENAKDDDEVKELKQQKRLLRNRQAALDSRQRKKQRAEELEVDNKGLRDQMAEMNERLSVLQLQAEQATREKNELLRENAQLKEHVQRSDWDKENLVVEHTKETSDLRKKIQVLHEIVEARDSSDPARPGATEYDFPITHEMSGLSVDGLDMYGLDDPFADFIMDELPSKPETSTLVLAPKKKPDEEKEDQSGPSGLLMLLLLCGAWVASKATTSMPVTIPRMPEEVRSDAAVVFDDLMKDHGVSTFQATGALEPAPSAANVGPIAFPMPSASASSRLDNMHSQLTTASKRQEAEAAFSLSAKQYNSLTSADFAEPPYSTPPDDDSPLPSHRRHLVDTLRSMREDAKGQATANVYTRSLLWQRLPDDVVQQFKRMADHSSQTASVNGDGGGGD